MTQTFTAKLIGRGLNGTWTFLPIPFDVLPLCGIKTKLDVQTFAALNYSRRKEFVDWISGAGQAATRALRVDQTILMVAAGKRLKN